MEVIMVGMWKKWFCGLVVFVCFVSVSVAQQTTPLITDVRDLHAYIGQMPPQEAIKTGNDYILRTSNAAYMSTSVTKFRFSSVAEFRFYDVHSGSTTPVFIRSFMR
jgi:hypothetical protein